MNIEQMSVVALFERAGWNGDWESVANEIARRNKLLEEAIYDLLVRHPGGLADSMCHLGIVPMEECNTCKAVLQGRAALKAYRGES